ncbi:uncharacterized protein LOC129308657 isoform X2 [Prosopis cineraria]|uniref:uncharacterized protein LOC129308657 isoform X2 n=1 Tax=Prosopis cineraria TaxID=364024 RepID=UPI00240FB989|nr:uncharacterized protein LOC129308657 isoform X2 [Prosopis cineraria]
MKASIRWSGASLPIFSLIITIILGLEMAQIRDGDQIEYIAILKLCLTESLDSEIINLHEAIAALVAMAEFHVHKRSISLKILSSVEPSESWL